jgi:hypothetical protein
VLIDREEVRRLREKGHGVFTAKRIVEGNELRRMVSNMISDQSWAILGQILERLIDVKFPREENQ